MAAMKNATKKIAAPAEKWDNEKKEKKRKKKKEEMEEVLVIRFLAGALCSSCAGTPINYCKGCGRDWCGVCRCLCNDERQLTMFCLCNNEC